jgi:uncharacterized protein YjbI with pentapeptide repeats
MLCVAFVVASVFLLTKEFSEPFGPRLRARGESFAIGEDARISVQVTAMDWRLARLDGSSFRNARLVDVDLAFADLRGAQFGSSQFVGGNFSQSNAEHADFSGVVFNGFDAQLMRAPWSRWVGARAEASRFQNSTLDGSSWTAARLQYSDFSGANLKGADFRGADLTHANFANADLSLANFTGAKLVFADLTGASMDDAILDHADVGRVRFGMSAADVLIAAAALQCEEADVTCHCQRFQYWWRTLSADDAAQLASIRSRWDSENLLIRCREK